MYVIRPYWLVFLLLVLSSLPASARTIHIVAFGDSATEGWLAAKKDAYPAQLEAALRLGAPVVEFHTGEYAHAEGDKVPIELRRIADMAALAAKNGIEPHAGHGLTYANVQPIAAIPQLAELNIGHYLIGEAIFVGLEPAVVRMRELMDAAR